MQLGVLVTIYTFTLLVHVIRSYLFGFMATFEGISALLLRNLNR